MINKKLLREISALKLDDSEMLNDFTMANYEQYLASFIENFPIIERKLKNALEEKDKEAIATGLKKLCLLLKNIQAKDLVAEGIEFLKVMESNDCDNERTLWGRKTRRPLRRN